MKIGCLFCAYNCDHSIDEVLKPWLEVKRRATPDQFILSFSYGQFKESADLFGAATIEYPAWYDRHKANVDHFQLLPPLSEAENRNAALRPLLEAGCDLIMLVDAQDEYFTVAQIDEIFNRVHLEKFVSWFSVPYRNFVFDRNTYLAENFCPPRIFRTKTNGWNLIDFYWDNDIRMGSSCFEFNKSCEKTCSYKDLPTKLIKVEPVRHDSWLSNSISRGKVKYQMAHFGRSGFKWNEIEDRLEFNEEYYQKLGQKIPEVIKIPR